MTRIAFVAVSKQFVPHKYALSDLNLEIAEGELLAILGPSGSGKSTLLRLIAGLETPSEGHLLFNQKDVVGRPPRDRDVAMVFQNQPPFPHLNIYENLAFSGRAKGLERVELDVRVREVADRLGLSDKLNRSPGTLSGGERQRVVLGRAIVRRPSILLLDEPFSNLDSPLRRELRSHLLRFQKELGATTLFVTHDQHEAVALGDRVAILCDGAIQQVGSATHLFRFPRSLRVAGFLGDPPMGLLSLNLVKQSDGWDIRFRHRQNETVWNVAEGSRWSGLLGRLGAGAFQLGLRAEGVQVVEPSGNGELPTLRLIIDEHSQQGTERFARLDQPGGLWVRLPREGPFEVGTEIPVQLDLDQANWFDPHSGLRVAPGEPPEVPECRGSEMIKQA